MLVSHQSGVGESVSVFGRSPPNPMFAAQRQLIWPSFANQVICHSIANCALGLATSRPGCEVRVKGN